jgi:hypothetical protein
MQENIIYIFYRFRFAFWQYPKRLFRLLTYLFHPFYHWKNGGSMLRSFPILLTDCFFILDIYETVCPFFKKNIRPLREREILKAQNIFGNNIDYRLVRIDERAKILTRSMGVIYVSGNTINSWGKMPDDVFIHELVHIWQYQKFGAGYISCALKAQGSPAGYNYAYTEGWYHKPSILNFNAEQQGDLVQDYYRLHYEAKTHWGNYTKADLGLYEKYIDELRTI